MVATSVAFSIDSTVTLPPLTLMLTILASTALRTSLRTTRPPIAIESESLMFRPCGIILVATSSCQ